jgi:UDP-glucose 4-epimerase
MRALVTGGAGFVGTNLVKRLLKEDYEVIVFDNYSTGFRENQIKGARYGDIDIRKEFINFYEDIDVIFHMAALPRIKPSFENPTEVVDVNVNGTANVLEYARRNDIPVIYAGSSSVHGGTYKNPYTFTKWQAEELCKMYEKIYGLDITICRFYNVYGDYMINEGSYRTVLSIFLEQYKNNKPLTITGDGEQRRDFTHVDDIVDGMIKCFEKKAYGEVFEFGRGKNYSINELVDMFGSDRIYIDEIPGEARETLRRDDYALMELNWKPKINLDEWLGEQL